MGAIFGGKTNLLISMVGGRDVLQFRKSSALSNGATAKRLLTRQYDFTASVARAAF
jgi:hypothetical protein